MRNKRLFKIFILFLFIFALSLSYKCFAKDLDRIEKYYITVDPREDGTLDMRYHIEWEVLDSTSEGPLEWVKIGVPNSHISNLRAISDNIKSIIPYNYSGNFIRVDFSQPYYEGKVISFDFEFNQSYMYQIDNDICKYTYTPGWFPDIEVKDIGVFWNSKNVKKADSASKNSDGYYEWRDELKHGEKLTIKLEYDSDSFTLDENKQVTNTKKTTNSINSTTVIIVFLFLLWIFSVCMMPGYGYRRHRGFGYGYGYGRRYPGYYSSYSHRSSRPSRSSCVSSCACACACAGGGRAGCSKKDFYGTTIKTKRLNKILNEKNK